MLDIKDNFTNDSHYGNYTQSDGYGRKDLLVIFYMGVSVRLITSLAIVISTSSYGTVGHQEEQEDNITSLLFCCQFNAN